MHGRGGVWRKRVVPHGWLLRRDNVACCIVADGSCWWEAVVVVRQTSLVVGGVMVVHVVMVRRRSKCMRDIALGGSPGLSETFGGSVEGDENEVEMVV